MTTTDLIRLYHGDRVSFEGGDGKPIFLRIARGKAYREAHKLKKSENPGGYVGEAWALHERDDTKKTPAKQKRRKP